MSRGRIDRADDAALGLEAAAWLLRLDDSDPDAAAEFPNAKARNAAFFDWLDQSPAHLRVFLETVETHRRMRLVDARHLIVVEDLLKQCFAEVVPLRTNVPWRTHAEQMVSAPARSERTDPDRLRRRRTSAVIAAAVALMGVAGYLGVKESGTYATAVGEQRMSKLVDGSFIYLNTDSKVEVRFSADTRNVRLVRGEALFVVQRDSARPFTVTAGDTTVRAVGTQFNVRRRAEKVDVAVVEGVVQVASLDEPQNLAAGEQATVAHGRIAARPRQAVADVVAWRQRRLVFHDTPLAEVAAEINRYNRTKIRVEGDAARDIQLSGIFDADRPQALVLYAARSAPLSVEPEGGDWVIRAR